ncbi:TPA_asm: flagellin FliC, partial [Salmonella enterica subsp. enterica serovar Heidelberg]
DNTLTIQVGANDGETIDIDLKQINSQTLGLDTLNVQQKYKVSDTAATVTGYTDSATAIDKSTFAASATTLGGTPAITGDLKFDDTTGKYYADVSGTTAKDGVYEVTVAADGKVTLTGTPTGPITAGFPSTATKDVKQTQQENADLTEAKAALTAAGVAAAGTASVVKMSYTDNNGKTIDGGLAVKVGDDYYSATQNKDGSISINTTKYTADDGTSKTALNKLGGADGKTEVVSIGGKTYAASKAEGHNFKAQPDLAEAAATTTENPLQKIDAALAQVDTLRSDLGAVQNRFNSAITNLGNTVNNLTSARSRIEDSDYATEVSNMSRAQILQQAGTSVLAQANQVPQNVLSLLR